MGCCTSKVAVFEPNQGQRGSVKNETAELTDTSSRIPGQDPLIKPSKKKKKDIVPSPDMFASIDEHALKAPISVRSSVSSLSEYLTKPAKNDLERIRAFYRWIADNISYDTVGFFGGDHKSQDADGVLTRGNSVCEGYATLFKALCDTVDIPCKKISGFSKAFGYNPEEKLTENSSIDHAWNIVFVAGEWRFIEGTWGAGHLNTERQYTKGFEEAYFLTDPEDFVSKHFPFMNKNLSTSSQYQLHKKPISLERFNEALFPNKMGISFAFHCLSHDKQVIYFEKECQIIFETLDVPLESILCRMSPRNTGEDLKRYVRLTRKDNKFVVKITPPKVGTYDLQLFGKPEGSQGTTHESLIDFILKCQTVHTDVRPYPTTESTWGAGPTALKFGFTNNVLKYDVLESSDGQFELTIATVTTVPVLLKLEHSEVKDENLKRFIFDYYEKNILVVKGRLPHKGFYKIVLFAKDPNKRDSGSYDHVADVLIDCRKALSNAKPYPKSYPQANEHNCRLYEPLSGDLPQMQETHLRLASDSLTRLMVNGNIYTKGSKNVFDVKFQTPEAGTSLTIYGSLESEGSLQGLYQFQIV